MTCLTFCDKIPDANAGIAQSVEQLIRNQQVVCSSHITSSKKLWNEIHSRAFYVWIHVASCTYRDHISLGYKNPLVVVLEQSLYPSADKFVQLLIKKTICLVMQQLVFPIDDTVADPLRWLLKEPVTVYAAGQD